MDNHYLEYKFTFADSVKILGYTRGSHSNMLSTLNKLTPKIITPYRKISAREYMSTKQPHRVTADDMVAMAFLRICSQMHIPLKESIPLLRDIGPAKGWGSRPHGYSFILRTGPVSHFATQQTSMDLRLIFEDIHSKAWAIYKKREKRRMAALDATFDGCDGM